MQNNYDRAVEIAEGVHWIGFYDPNSNFHCNPYLVVVEGEGILIDPGSNPQFPKIASKLSPVLDFRKIQYIIVSHQDPDLASNIPVFEKLDLKLIAPQHGSVIKKELIPKCIGKLKRMKVGGYLNEQ